MEHFLTCPYCWETISILLDTSINNQTYIEDCEVCCNPMEFNVKFKDEQLTSFTVQQIQ